MQIKKIGMWMAFAVISLSSCVSKKQFDSLQLNYQSCLENAGQKESTIQGLNAKIDGLQNQANLLKNQNDQLAKSLSDCLSNTKNSSVNINQLIGEIQSSNGYIKKLIASAGKKDSLNLVLSDRLKRSLDDLNDRDVDIKVLKGVVFISLSDNMLYKSGSYDILPQAEVVLAKVAKVINDYKDYDVLVEGHTDNNPIKSSLIKDNWDLSALRATSVVRTLQNKFAVDPARMTAGGRSEFVPKGDNLTEKGRTENRRTEIIILPKLDEFMKLMEIAPTKMKN